MERPVHEEGGVHHDGWVDEVGAVGEPAQRQQTPIREARVYEAAVARAAGD